MSAKRDKTADLLLMAEEGSLKYLKRLIRQKTPVNSTNDEGQIALHKACQVKHRECVKYLLSVGADVNATDSHGCTPMLYAVMPYDGDEEEFGEKCVDSLIRAGANVNQNEPLAAAVASFNNNAVDLLVNANANLSAVDGCGHTALFKAAKNGNDYSLDVLLKAGADLNVTDEKGCPPLVAAVGCGEDKCVEMLIRAGADVNVTDNENQTPLIAASRLGQIECVRKLIKANANLNLQDRDGRTALMCAVEFGYHKCAKLLVENIAGVNATFGKSYLALRLGHKKLGFTLGTCEDVYSRSKPRVTPL